MSQLRLQKYIAQCGIASRRGAEELIEEGRVSVNGHVVETQGTKVDPAIDVVKVGNRVLRQQKRGVILLHKPRDVVCSRVDPGGRRTVLDFLDRKHQSYFPVGRLDDASSGLVVMTNDGELAERLCHPRYELERIYEVKVAGIVDERLCIRLNKGVVLEDGPVRARVKILRREDGATWLKVTLTEGRNRVIRRMMDQVRRPVRKLRRISHGPLHLGRLRSGKILELKPAEYQELRAQVVS